MRLVSILVFSLVAAVWALAAREFAGQYQRYRLTQELVRSNRMVDHLVLAGRDLIFERGRINLRLAAATPLDEDSGDFIARLRRSGGGHFHAALATMSGEAAAPLLERWRELETAREEVDRQLRLPPAERNPDSRRRWFAVSTDFLARMQQGLHLATLRNNRFDPSFRLITRIKLTALSLRESLGEESSRIGAAAAQGVIITQPILSDLARLRGRSETQMSMLDMDIKAADHSELQMVMNRVGAALSERLRPLQDEIVARSQAGAPMTLPASSYSSVAVPVLEEVGRLFDQAQRHSTRIAEDIENRAMRLMLASLGLTLLALALGGGAVVLLRRRLLRPLFAIGEELRDLVGGYRDFAVVEPGGGDELDELRAAVATFRNMLSDRLALWQALPDMIVYKGDDGRWLGLNAEAVRYLRVAPALVQGKTDAQVAESYPHLQPWLQAATAGDTLMWRSGQPQTREEVVATLDGDAVFFQVVRIPLFHADGRRRGQLIVGRDVTDRRRAEAATARLSRQNHLILECAGEGIAGIDAEGRTIFFNPAASRMTGWDAEDVVGLSLHSVMHHSHADGSVHSQADCPVSRTLEDGIARHYDHDLFWCKDGSALPVEFTVNSLVEQDQARGAVIIFRDIRARLAAEQEIRSLLGELRRSNQELERFAYVASHDLRQPLRMINGYMSMLQKRLGDKLGEEERSFFSFATDGAKRMDRMILDLLDYSRIGRNRDTEVVDLAETVDMAVATLAVAIAEAGADVRVREGLPRVRGVRSELERLFQNLIANAIKFRDGNRAPVVEIGCRDEGARWVLWVKDNGIGIAAKDHDRLFAIFQRLVPQERYDGTGIGLASVRKIADHHGGQVWVESELGQGATFLVALPKG